MIEFTQRDYGNGFWEVAIRQNGQLVGVITRPCKGAKWFVHVGPHSHATCSKTPRFTSQNKARACALGYLAA